MNSCQKVNKREGGLRTKGFYKASLPRTPLITIITVVYNNFKGLEETILSVLNQTWANVEYIIIDGGSSDKTIDVIKKFDYCIDYWVTEPDEGIYDAMNKGIDLAKGKWLNFMNAGDNFYRHDVIEKVFSSLICNNYKVLYGDHEVRSSGQRIERVGRIGKIWKGSRFSHQSAFIASDFHKINKYNTSNKIGADFEFFYKAYKRFNRFKYINLVVSSVSSDGISDKRRIESILSRWYVIDKSLIVNLFYSWLILKEILKEFVKKAFINFKSYVNPFDEGNHE